MRLDCGHQIKKTSTAFGKMDGKTLCYPCCAKVDKKWMMEKGRIDLYLTLKKTTDIDSKYRLIVSNWPNSLVFPCTEARYGRHNWGICRTDVWFDGPDGHIWHGVNYGDHTEIVHCKRTMKRWK